MSEPESKIAVSNVIGHYKRMFNIRATWPPWRTGQRHVSPAGSLPHCWCTTGRRASAFNAKLRETKPRHATKGRLQNDACL